jgi:hypothetical protein
LARSRAAAGARRRSCSSPEAGPASIHGNRRGDASCSPRSPSPDASARVPVRGAPAADENRKGRSRHQVARGKGLTSSCTPRTSFCVSSCGSARYCRSPNGLGGRSGGRSDRAAGDGAR